MTACPAAIQALVDHLEVASAHRFSRQRALEWAACEPILSSHSAPADLAAAIRAACPAHQDALIGALLRLGGDDQLAQLTVLAGLSRRLGWVVTGWKRAGVPTTELRTLESDLVSEGWMAVAAAARAIGAGEDPPPRPAMSIVQEAWQQVRGPRRRQRRHEARYGTAVERCPGSARPAVPAGEELAVAIVSAVRARQVSVTGARLVFATRVAGWSVAETAERLGCSPQSVRTRRARAEQRLAAA